MKAKEAQEPPEHPLELTKVSIHGPQLAQKLRNILIWDQSFLTGLDVFDEIHAQTSPQSIVYDPL
jgi:hypothetical protein